MAVYQRAPHLVGLNEIRIGDKEQVLAVLLRGLARPVERTGDNELLIEDGEPVQPLGMLWIAENHALVVHVRSAVVESQGDTAAAKVLDIATKALGLLVVTDDADSNACVA